MAAQTGPLQADTVQTGRAPGMRQFGDSTGPETVIAVSGLVKRYGDIEAVRGIDFDGRQGGNLRLPRPERGGQVHDDQDPVHARQRDGRDSDGRWS